jgi:hypothetical protein
MVHQPLVLQTVPLVLFALWKDLSDVLMVLVNNLTHNVHLIMNVPMDKEDAPMVLVHLMDVVLLLLALNLHLIIVMIILVKKILEIALKCQNVVHKLLISALMEAASLTELIVKDSKNVPLT